MAIKTLRVGWSRDTFQTQHPSGTVHEYHKNKRFLQ